MCGKKGRQPNVCGKKGDNRMCVGKKGETTYQWKAHEAPFVGGLNRNQGASFNSFPNPVSGPDPFVGAPSTSPISTTTGPIHPIRVGVYLDYVAVIHGSGENGQWTLDTVVHVHIDNPCTCQ